MENIIFIGTFLFIYWLIKRVLRVFNIKNSELVLLILAVVIGLIVIYFFFSLKKSSLDNSYGINRITKEGKIFIKAPDSMRIYKSEKFIVRIAKLDLDGFIFSKNVRIFKDTFNKSETIIIDTITLGDVMTVNLKEYPNEGRVIINRINNNATQVIDTTKYSEWVFDVKPMDDGYINLFVTVSSNMKMEFGDNERDLPVYEKRVKIYATNTDKMTLYWQKFMWAFVLVGLFLINSFYKLYQNLKTARKDKALKNDLSIKSIDDFIRDGNIIVALELALKKNDIPPDDKTYFTVQLARFKNLETDKGKGVINDNDYRIAYNQIMNAVIERMQELGYLSNPPQ